MPAGVPVATVAVGEAGATNAALLAARILALEDEELRSRLRSYREKLAEAAAKDRELG
jgi:5-(carboxyamino)imidazole ribonucleotide mutase